MEHLDSTDRAILYVLQTDAREVTNTEISERVGVSPTTVGERIARLQERGVIKTSYTEIDYEKAGIPHYLLLFCTAPIGEREGVVDDVVGEPGVVTVRELLTGEQNLQIEIVGTSREDVAETIEALEDLGIDIHDVEIIKGERRRPFDGFGRRDTVG